MSPIAPQWASPPKGGRTSSPSGLQTGRRSTQGRNEEPRKAEPHALHPPKLAGIPALASLARVAAFLLLLAPGPRASGSPASEFRYRFRQGVEALKQGRLKEALDRFLQAHRLAPNPNTVRNIALCLEKLGRLYEAFSFYQELATFPKVDRDNRRFAEKALKRLAPRVARVRVETDPPGATLYLDRRALGAYGTTPVEVAEAPGRHSIIVEKPGFHRAVRTVTLTIGRVASLKVPLRPVVGILDVDTDPPGALVRLDEDSARPLGRTPARLEVPPGRHVLILTRKGYSRAVHRVTVTEKVPRHVRVSLRALPPPTGSLHIQSNVLGAVVELDGRPVGMTPFLRNDVPVGEHRISVTATGKVPWKGRVLVRHGARSLVMVQLERRPRRRSLGPWPWVSLGVSAALLVSTVTLAGLSHKNYLDYEAADEPTSEDLERGRRLAIASDALLGTFLVSGLATGLTFFFLKPEHFEPSTGSVKIEPLAAPSR